MLTKSDIYNKYCTPPPISETLQIDKNEICGNVKDIKAIASKIARINCCNNIGTVNYNKYGTKGFQTLPISEIFCDNIIVRMYFRPQKKENIGKKQKKGGGSAKTKNTNPYVGVQNIHIREQLKTADINYQTVKAIGVDKTREERHLQRFKISCSDEDDFFGLLEKLPKIFTREQGDLLL